MAAPQNRTVTLTLDAQTTGLDGVKALSAELNRLAKEGGDAAPEFTRLSDELSQIAEQKAVASAFSEIADKVSQAKVALDATRQSAQAHSDALAKLKSAADTSTQAFRIQEEAMRQARAEVQQANTGLLQARAELAQYAASIGGANRATREQRTELNALRQTVLNAKGALAQARATVSELTPAYDEMRAAAGQASSEVKKQEGALSSANAEVKRAQEAHDGLQQKLSAVSNTLTQMGVNIADVSGEQSRLTQTAARLSAEADRLKKSLADAGTTAKVAGRGIEDAFGTVGVRSAAAIKAEIQRVRSAMMQLATSASVTDAEFNRAFTASKAKIAELEKQLTSAEKATRSFGDGFGSALRQFAPATVVFNAVSAGIQAIVSAGTRIPKVAAEFETMNRVLKVLTGSTAAAAREFSYIRDVANRVGGDIKAVGDSYIRLSAATKGSALEGAQTKRVFEAVAGSMGMLGASAADTENALMAVTQMVSKGVVSMEEMRQQLGERLPGAFQATAKELGITTGDLNDLISSGNLTAEQMLPALAGGLEKLYQSGQQNDTLTGQWYRFTNAVKEASNAIGGESGLVKNLLQGLRVATAGVQGFIEYTVLGAQQVGILAGAIIHGDFQTAMVMIREGFDKANERIKTTAGLSEPTRKSLADLAKEAKASGAEFVTMADGTQIAAAAIESFNQKTIAFMVESAKAEKSADGLATSARKVAEYTRSAGEASITAANAIGTEADKRAVATKVAEDNAAALEKLLAAEREVLAVQEQRMRRLVDEVAAKGAASDADLKIIQALEAEIEKRQTVISGIQTQVDANNILAQSLQLQAATLQDNSDNLVAYREHSLALAEALAQVRAEVEAGRMSQEQLTVVEIEARKANAMYVDALRDQAEKMTALSAQKQAQLDVDVIAIKLAIEQQKTIQATSKARGDEYNAMLAALEIKKLEIKLVELTAVAKKAEAEAVLQLVKNKREELIATNQMTPAKEAELRAQEASANVKKVEGEIASETAKRMKELADITYFSGGAASTAADGYDKLASKLGKVASEADKASDAVDALNESYLNSTGTREASVDSKDVLYRNGATIEEAKVAEKYFAELMQRETAASGGLRPEFLDAALQKAAGDALKLARAEMRTGQEADLGNSFSEILAQKQATTPQTNSNSANDLAMAAAREAKAQPVVFNVNGKQTKVNVASSSDVTALQSLLQQLEFDASRSL